MKIDLYIGILLGKLRMLGVKIGFYYLRVEDNGLYKKN